MTPLASAQLDKVLSCPKTQNLAISLCDLALVPHTLRHETTIAVYIPDEYTGAIALFSLVVLSALSRGYVLMGTFCGGKLEHVEVLTHGDIELRLMCYVVCVQRRSKTQGIALSLGDKLILKQKG